MALINWRLMRNPMNYVTIISMLLIAAFAVHVVEGGFTTHNNLNQGS